MITRPRLIPAAVLLGAAAAVAAIIWTTVVNFGTDVPGTTPRGDRLFTLGVLSLGFAGLLAVPGAVLTIAFLRWRRPWLRGLYYMVLFPLLVANLLVFATGGHYVTFFCLTCGLEMWWTQTIVPASVFVAIAPLVWSMPRPRTALEAGYDRPAGLLRRLTESLLHEPPDGARFPRTTLWLAAAPWLFWIFGRLMIDGPMFGAGVYNVLPASYVAAYIITLVGTPLLGYRIVRDARQMSRVHKAWSLAGFGAGLACYALVYSSLRIFL